MGSGSPRYAALLVLASAAALAALSAPAPAAAASPYAQEVLADAPTAYWRLGESTGVAAANAGGIGFVAEYLNGVFLGAPGAITGDPDTSASFDGVDDLLQSALVTAKTADLTLEAWVYPTAVRDQLVVYSGHSGLDGYGIFLSDGFCGAGDQFFLLLGGIACNGVGSAGVIPANTWTHVVVTRSAAGTWRLYVNGELKTSGLTNPNAPTANGTRIGGNGGNNQFSGRIDEVAVYEKALTGARILAHYQAAGAPATSGPFVLDPATGEAFVGAQQFLTARFTANPIPTGTSVTFTVEGENPSSSQTPLDSTGRATFAYSGGFEGLDTVTARLATPSGPLASNPATVSWQVGPVTRYPGSSLSFYQDTANQRELLQQGKDAAALLLSRPAGAPRRMIVILSWGEQKRLNSGAWGTTTINFELDRTMAQIRMATQAFAEGFFRGTISAPAARLTLVMGTVNSNPSLMKTVAADMGRVWAQNVQQVRDALRTKPAIDAPAHWSDRVSVVGGIDLESEFCPGASCANGAKGWISAYDVQTVAMLINFGACVACDNSTQRDGFGWTFTDYREMNGGQNVFVVPQIYAEFVGGVSENARQWATYLNSTMIGRRIVFLGALSQHTACLEPGGCPAGTDNTCQEAWQSLWETAGQRSLPWSSDFARSYHRRPETPC